MTRVKPRFVAFVLLAYILGGAALGFLPSACPNAQREQARPEVSARPSPPPRPALAVALVVNLAMPLLVVALSAAYPKPGHRVPLLLSSANRPPARQHGALNRARPVMGRSVSLGVATSARPQSPPRPAIPAPRPRLAARGGPANPPASRRRVPRLPPPGRRNRPAHPPLAPRRRRVIRTRRASGGRFSALVRTPTRVSAAGSEPAAPARCPRPSTEGPRPA